jgi:hypothetical protein
MINFRLGRSRLEYKTAKILGVIPLVEQFIALQGGAVASNDRSI